MGKPLLVIPPRIREFMRKTRPLEAAYQKVRLLRMELAFAQRRRQFQGDGPRCNCCGSQVKNFVPNGNRPKAKCPVCHASERHRAVAWFLDDWINPNELERVREVLHIAPEPAFELRFRKRFGAGYFTADQSGQKVMGNFSIEAIPFPKDRFDFVYCSHVLEHVGNDRRALREIHRVLRPQGLALLQVPIEPTRATTYEDPKFTSPEDRKTHFLQEDHVRLYGWDYLERLKEAGFSVERIPFEKLARKVGETNFLLNPKTYPYEEIFLCRKAEKTP